MYAEHVKTAADSEARTDTFIEQCITIYRRAFADPVIEGVIRWCDEQFGHKGPFHSIALLYATVTRTKDTPKLQWLVSYMMDIVRLKVIEPNELSVRQLSGGGGQTSYGALILLKKQMLEYMLRSWMPNHNFPPTTITTMTEKIGSHKAFRRNYISYPDSEAEADLSWMKGWPKSAELILQFF